MRKKLFVTVGMLLVGTSLCSLYSHIVISEPQDRFEKIKRKFYLKENSIKVNFELSKDAYLLKVKHKTDKDQGRKILFNGVEFAANIFPYERKKGDFEDSYLHLPKEIVKQGENTIEITFSDTPASEVCILLRNYRKYLSDGIYILFSDSANLPAGKVTSIITPLINILILSLGIVTCFIGRGVCVGKDRLFLRRHGYLWLPFFILLLLFLSGWINSTLGYRVVVKPAFFWGTIFIFSIIFFIIKLLETPENLSGLLSKIENSKAIEFCLAEKEFGIRTGAFFFILIIMVNLWVYWPSFFHLFRHDEWFLFFSSKDVTPNLQFIVKHIDWQLKLPYDRLIFRPICTSGLAANRVLFGTNYIGPHILTFLKHMGATFLLWLVMWQTKRVWLSGLFALLFSLLRTGAGPVMWPHVDAYIATTIFILSAMFIFSLIINGRISSNFGFSIISILIFLGLLTTQLVLVLPFLFFGVYRFLFSKKDEERLKHGNKSAWLLLFAPLFLWGICFLIHLYFAYPFNMTSQSNMISLWKIIPNILKFVVVVLIGNISPINVQVRLADKMYFYISLYYLLVPLLLLGGFLIFKCKIINYKTREIFLPFLLLFSIVSLICLTRAAYIDSTLSFFGLPSYCAYCINAILVFMAYCIIDFDVLKSRRLRLVFLIMILLIMILHGVKTYNTGRDISNRTEPLKKYFDSVRDFVAVHKKEPGFSFKIIDRPPKIDSFNWYSETCIDGLFNPFINNKKPKYILEYDYSLERLRYSLSNQRQQLIQALDVSANTSKKEADFVNSIGIQFKKVSGREHNFLMSIFEVTQKQWVDVMGFNPSRFKNDSHPVENVSYHMVQEFIERLNRIDKGNCYRLPTEKEYLHLINSFMADFSGQIKSIDKYAWLKGNAKGTTHPVGRLEPVPVGIYDFIGNVWEWTTSPIHSDSPASSFEENPRVCFGGSWRGENIDLYRLKTNYPPDFRHEHLGFRLVRKINAK